MHGTINQIIENYKNSFKPKKFFVSATPSFAWLRIVLKNVGMLPGLLATVVLT
jgi:hypothetical protein